jgi:proteasome assembly chaperone (PAC2) family protein
MEFIKVDELPELRRGIMVAAFGGWGDAGEIATTATRLLVKQFRAKKFASLDPEEFYDFTKTRPTTQIVSSTERTLEWPANDFYYWQDQAGDHDYLFLIGIDPHLRWKHFVGEILDLAGATGVEMILTLGGYLGEVPHSRIGQFTGRANRPDLEARLADLGVMPSSYQGPTGIHSVLMDATERAGLPNASLWGVVPHYIPMVANPKVCAALLRKVSDFLAIDVDLREMDLAARQFERQVNEAIRQNPEVAAYVKQLEESLPPEETLERPDAGREPELPSGEVVVRDLEEFLRRRQQGGGSEGSTD